MSNCETCCCQMSEIEISSPVQTITRPTIVVDYETAPTIEEPLSSDDEPP